MKLSRQEFLDWPNKVVTLLGMSGVGKTVLSSKLPQEKWFHYSGDYRIGTKYLQEPILDNIKKHAMEQPFLRDLILSDSIYICSNISVHHLKPVSTFLGKLGNPELDGLTREEFEHRQQLYREAEIKAMNDVPEFVHKGLEIYGYPHFINDAGGSVCELSDTDIWRNLAKHSIIVYLKADSSLEQLMIERAKASPKPMYYDRVFLNENLTKYLHDNKLKNTQEINPDEFLHWVFPRLITHRRPLYEGIADEFGYTIDATDMMALQSEEDILHLIAEAL